MTPALPSGAAQTAYLPAPTVAEVSLTGLSFSLTDLVGLLGNFDLGGLGGLGGLLPDLGGLSPDLARAVLVEFIKEASPLLKTAAGDIFQYTTSSVTGLVIGPNSIPVRFGSAIAEIPAVVKTALGDLKDRDFAAALQTLNQGLLAPATAIVEAVKDVADGIRTFVTTQVSTFVAAVPGLVLAAIEAVIGNSGQGFLEVIKNAVNGLFGAGAAAGSKLAAIVEGDVISDTPASDDIKPVADTEPADDADTVDVDTAPAAAAVAPKAAAVGAAAAARAVAPAAAAESAIEAGPAAESPAPEISADEAAAPATRSRAGARRSAGADEVGNGPVATTRHKSAQRADRQGAERPRAASASRAG